MWNFGWHQVQRSSCPEHVTCRHTGCGAQPGGTGPSGAANGWVWDATAHCSQGALESEVCPCLADPACGTLPSGTGPSGGAANGWEWDATTHCSDISVPNSEPCPTAGAYDSDNNAITCPGTTEEMGNPDALVLGCTGNPETNRNYCVVPAWTSSGLMWDQTTCEAANTDAANPTHKWANSMMHPTLIRHDSLDGTASNGEDHLSSPTNVRSRDTPSVQAVADAASTAAVNAELSDTDNAENEGYMMTKVHHVLNSVADLNPTVNPSVSSLLSLMGEAQVKAQAFLNDISQDGTNMVTPRGLGNEAAEDVCYEVNHEWPHRL